MGQSLKKRQKKIFSRNRKNHNEKIKNIDRNYDVLKDLGFSKIIEAELKTKPNK